MHDWHWGCERFINLSKLPNTHGFIKNVTCIFEADISVTSRDERANHACQVASKPAASVENVANPLASSGGELVDFKNFGKIEEAFVPLLEEVCSWHPSLIDCQRKRKRSPRFTEWAFTALGQVLHFLKNKKVKDMNEDACSHLGFLWEELETFKFDLTWLQPHVQSALSKKSFVEKVVQLKTLKENVVALDMEFKSVEEKLFSAKEDLEKAIRDLSKEGFQERDLDAELGYGGP
ncbi:uncharacterized protein LOC130719945 [Lotus japonicus]|uniref:uncharacterized protein LOC130719945 n=1 Tax=Lotus japonicus TaxID=34305 RepID=UPI002589F91E|nr:uncharacterized protein LOC130719945 [Lotus japonicus]